MNKQCTNSSCRRTFSTLNADGKCPHCGKSYPQLNSRRKHAFPGCIRLRIRTGKDYCYLNIRLDEALRLGQNGEKIKMIAAFRNQLKAQGYLADLKTAKDFCENLLDRKEVMTEWYLTGEEREGIKYIRLAEESGAQIKRKILIPEARPASHDAPNV